MFKKITVFILIFIFLSCKYWQESWGDYSLGNHLSLLDGDKKEDRVIVYCTGKSWGTCRAGISVIPIYSKQFDSSLQHYAEYVDTALSNKKWVIAKTYQIQEKKENYRIINKDFNIENLDCEKVNCDSILQSHVIGPLSLSEFENKKKELDINLNFK